MRKLWHAQAPGASARPARLQECRSAAGVNPVRGHRAVSNGSGGIAAGLPRQPTETDHADTQRRKPSPVPHRGATALRAPCAGRRLGLAAALGLGAAPARRRWRNWAASTSYPAPTAGVLSVYPKDGRHWVVGTPGQEYGIRVCNTTGDRVLAVMSVDGVNVVSGETASPAQSGYVLSAHECADINGWRKTDSHHRGVLLHGAARRLCGAHGSPRERRRHRRRVLPRTSAAHRLEGHAGKNRRESRHRACRTTGRRRGERDGRGSRRGHRGGAPAERHAGDTTAVRDG